MDKKPTTKKDITDEVRGVLDSIFEDIEPDMTIEHLPPKEEEEEQTRIEGGWRPWM